MDKATFLVQLQKNIGMLDDAEQKDIIDEYTQHIDMKVSSGMTEEAAIEDFGNFEDFVREVLSAYHVKAPFDQTGFDRGPLDQAASDQITPAEASNATLSAGEDLLNEVVRSGSNAASKATAAAKDGARKMVHAVSSVMDKASDRMSTSNQDATDASVDEPAATEATSRSALQATGRLASSSWSAVWRGARTLLRWCWNVCVMCFAAFLLFLALMCLIGVGVGFVLLAQGYPLLGVSIGAVGAATALLALAYLLSRLVARKERAIRPPKPCHPVRPATIPTWAAEPSPFATEPPAPASTNPSASETLPSITVSLAEQGGTSHD